MTDSLILSGHLEWVPPSLTLNPHILDKKYPHSCYNPDCKKSLYFEELYNTNMRIVKDTDTIGYGNFVRYMDFDMPLYRRLKKLWRSPIIEFYCCDCYNFKELIEKNKNKPRW